MAPEVEKLSPSSPDTEKRLGTSRQVEIMFHSAKASAKRTSRKGWGLVNRQLSCESQRALDQLFKVCSLVLVSATRVFKVSGQHLNRKNHHNTENITITWVVEVSNQVPGTCLYIYTCIYPCIYIYTCIYPSICTCTHLYICTSVHVYIYMSTHIYIHNLYIYTSTIYHIYTHIFYYLSTCMHVYNCILSLHF